MNFAGGVTYFIGGTIWIQSYFMSWKMITSALKL